MNGGLGKWLSEGRQTSSGNPDIGVSLIFLWLTSNLHSKDFCLEGDELLGDGSRLCPCP